ncbi:unnamed protein product [Closterium sp. NIES-54]
MHPMHPIKERSLAGSTLSAAASCHVSRSLPAHRIFLHPWPLTPRPSPLTPQPCPQAEVRCKMAQRILRRLKIRPQAEVRCKMAQRHFFLSYLPIPSPPPLSPKATARGGGGGRPHRSGGELRGCLISCLTFPSPSLCYHPNPQAAARGGGGGRPSGRRGGSSSARHALQSQSAISTAFPLSAKTSLPRNIPLSPPASPLPSPCLPPPCLSVPPATRFDPRISEFAAHKFQRDGITVHTHARVTAVTPRALHVRETSSSRESGSSDGMGVEGTLVAAVRRAAV